MEIVNILLLLTLFPILFELIFVLVFYIRYDVKYLRRLCYTFNDISEQAKVIKTNKKNNLSVLGILEENFELTAPKPFQDKWNYMKNQVQQHYNGVFMPDAEYFFTHDTLFDLYGGRRYLQILLKYFWVFEALALCIPITVSLLYDPSILDTAFGYGLGAFIMIALIRIVFAFVDGHVFRICEEGYIGFVNTFNTTLSVSGQETALLVDMIASNQRSFEKGVKLISAKFDGFADETILPALKGSMNILAKEQKHAMQTLAITFAEELTKTLDIKMSDLAKTIASIGEHFSLLNKDLSENITGIDTLLTAQRTVLAEASKSLILSEEAQIEALAQTKELLQNSAENSHTLTAQISKMGETVDRLTEQNTVFTTRSNEIFSQINQTQLQIDNKMQSHQEQVESIVQRSADMLQNITEKMKEAMAEAGKEISLGIQAATGDNAEAIEKLSEQSKLLRDDFDNYFTRIEEHTKTTSDDMEYHVQNIIARITEETNKILQDNMDVHRTILSDYKESTTNLLMSFKEEADSISLYAKEINLDISELSESLKSSVTEFNEALQNNIETTLGEFDSGLGELSARIANTVENIRDAVEALPSALKKK